MLPHCHVCQKDSTYIIPSYSYIHSYETRSTNVFTSISRMQKCPIGHIEDMFLFSLRYKTVRGQENLPDYAAEAQGFESCVCVCVCVGRKWRGASAYTHTHTHTHSLTTRLHGERQNNTDSSTTSHAILLRRIEREREGYRGTSTRLYGAWRSHATKLYGGLSSLYNQTPMTTTTATTPTTTAAAAAAFFNIIITHILHSHIHCDLDHSCSKLTLHDLH